MKEKKTKRINIRISLNDYLNLIADYTKSKYPSFSAYIRSLLDLEPEYYEYKWTIEE